MIINSLRNQTDCLCACFICQPLFDNPAQAKKTKPESGKSSSGGGGAKLGGGDQFPGLPAPSKKPGKSIIQVYDVKRL